MRRSGTGLRCASRECNRTAIDTATSPPGRSDWGVMPTDPHTHPLSTSLLKRKTVVAVSAVEGVDRVVSAQQTRRGGGWTDAWTEPLDRSAGCAPPPLLWTLSPPIRRCPQTCPHSVHTQKILVRSPFSAWLHRRGGHDGRPCVCGGGSGNAYRRARSRIRAVSSWTWS